MHELIEFLDAHDGSLMVIITIVYVLATIFICYFNGKSARATQEQIEESRRQYEETKRLQMMPILQLSDRFISEHSASAYCTLTVTPANESWSGFFFSCENTFSVRNIGLGNMKEATYCWTDETGQIVECGIFPIESLRAGEEAELTINFESHDNDEKKTREKISCLLELAYKDLLENVYTQRITFILAIQNPEQCYNCSPLLLKNFSVSRVLRDNKEV